MYVCLCMCVRGESSAAGISLPRICQSSTHHLFPLISRAHLACDLVFVDIRRVKSAHIERNRTVSLKNQYQAIKGVLQKSSYLERICPRVTLSALIHELLAKMYMNGKVNGVGLLVLRNNESKRAFARRNINTGEIQWAIDFGAL